MCTSVPSIHLGGHILVVQKLLYKITVKRTDTHAHSRPIAISGPLNWSVTMWRLQQRRTHIRNVFNVTKSRFAGLPTRTFNEHRQLVGQTFNPPSSLQHMNQMTHLQHTAHAIRKHLYFIFHSKLQSK